MQHIITSLEELEAALRKKTDEFNEERRRYKNGSPYEVYLCGVIQGIHYALHYPAAGIAYRPNIEGKSREQDKIEEPCEHHYVPIDTTFLQVDAVICSKCGDGQCRYNVVREKNPKFPWTIYPLLKSESEGQHE